MTNNNNGVNGSAGGEPAASDMDSLEEMLRKISNATTKLPEYFTPKTGPDNLELYISVDKSFTKLR